MGLLPQQRGVFLRTHEGFRVFGLGFSLRTADTKKHEFLGGGKQRNIVRGETLNVL